MDTGVFICHTQTPSCTLATWHEHRLQSKLESNPIQFIPVHYYTSFAFIALPLRLAWLSLPRDPIVTIVQNEVSNRILPFPINLSLGNCLGESPT